MGKARAASRIIGGMFGLQEIPPLNRSTPPFLSGRDILLVNARSGIWLLIEILSPPQVWMPSYLCDSMLKAIGEDRKMVRFYEVNYDLGIASLEWLDEVGRGDLVILVDYFGFLCDPVCATRSREQGAWVLEDACQALLSSRSGQLADFVLYSPRKFLGIPDGGILSFNTLVEFERIDLSPPPQTWWLKAFSATVIRREFDRCGGSRRWFELHQEVEAESPTGGYTMSELSRTLLVNGFDYSAIAERRVDNYKALSDQLGDLALYRELPAEVVPLGFPIRVKNRDQVRRSLFRHEVYPPIHWPIRDIVPAEFVNSHQLASEIITLPCDQRYDHSDMERMAKLVLEAAG